MESFGESFCSFAEPQVLYWFIECYNEVVSINREQFFGFLTRFNIWNARQMNSFCSCRICFISFPPQVTRIPRQFQNADWCELCRVCLVFLAVHLAISFSDSVPTANFSKVKAITRRLLKALMKSLLKIFYYLPTFNTEKIRSLRWGFINYSGDKSISQESF